MNTEFLDYINWVAVFCGAIGYFFLGALWYSKLLFAPLWIKLIKDDVNAAGATKGMAGIMVASFILMFITSLAIAILRSKMELEGGWISGVKLGLLTGTAFGAASISISYLYEKRPFALHLINGVYTILGNVIAAVIICSWI